LRKEAVGRNHRSGEVAGLGRTHGEALISTAKGAYTACRGLTSVLETVIEEKRKREQLKVKRDLLFERYLKHPMDAHLAIEIKTIDDQIAEHAKRADRKTGTRN